MDFSRPYWPSFHAVVVPLQFDSKMWYIIDPFQFHVWILFIASIPIYLTAMGLADYVYHGLVNWDDIGGHLIRNVLSENNFRLPDRKQTYQKLLDITWIWSMFVIVLAFSCNLTAILAKPKLKLPIKTLDGLMNQDEISWVLEKETLVEHYMKSSNASTPMKKLYDGAKLMPHLTPTEQFKYGCYAAKLKGNGNYASICDIGLILPMYAKDYSATGKCNFYILEETFLSSVYAMAFQVSVKIMNIETA